MKGKVTEHDFRYEVHQYQTTAILVYTLKNKRKEKKRKEKKTANAKIM